MIPKRSSSDQFGKTASGLTRSPPTSTSNAGPRSRKARNLRRDPRLALSLAPADNPFQPVIIRGRVTEWLEGDHAWEIIDQIATKYTGQPYTRDKERIVAVVEPDQQTIGIG